MSQRACDGGKEGREEEEEEDKLIVFVCERDCGCCRDPVFVHLGPLDRNIEKAGARMVKRSKRAIFHGNFVCLSVRLCRVYS